MRERRGASVLVVLREGQALANPEPGLVLRLVHQSTAPFTGAVIRSTPNGLIPNQYPLPSGSAPELARYPATPTAQSFNALMAKAARSEIPPQ
jgi:hypothetical protein